MKDVPLVIMLFSNIGDIIERCKWRKTFYYKLQTCTLNFYQNYFIILLGPSSNICYYPENFWMCSWVGLCLPISNYTLLFQIKSNISQTKMKITITNTISTLPVFNDTINTKKSNKWRQKTEIMDGTKHECL